MRLIRTIVFIVVPFAVSAHRINKDSAFIASNYTKIERMIPMRDGVKLFTSIYIPKGKSEKYPFLLKRTPYASAPYGEHNISKILLGPNKALTYEKYIFVSQDVRGRYKSGGGFEDVRPIIDNKKSKTEVDESSDTFDTVEWLLKNIENHNGRVGIYGISFMGF